MDNGIFSVSEGHFLQTISDQTTDPIKLCTIAKHNIVYYNILDAAMSDREKTFVPFKFI